MRCTSPLYKVNNLIYEGKKLPSFLTRKKFLNYKDFIHLRDKYGVNEQFFTRINCGQCLSCRILYAKQWAERCVLESTLHLENYFCTFTYEDKFLHFNDNYGVPVLYKKDMQDLFKRMRYYFGDFSYFGCGEYGDTTFRPHYHLLFFGLHLDDLEVYKIKKSKNNTYVYYNSPKLTEVWGKGFVVIGTVNDLTCEYTARYSLKKILFRKVKNLDLNDLSKCNFSDYHNYLQSNNLIQPCYSMMSRRPAIGRRYYNLYKDLIYSKDSIPGSKLNHLRYFDKIFEVDEPDTFLRIKEDRLKTLDVLCPYNHSSYNEDRYYDIIRENVKKELKVREN